MFHVLEVGAECPSQSLFTLSFESGSLSEPGTHCSTTQADQQTSRILSAAFPVLALWPCVTTLIFFFFKWRMGPGDPKSRKSRSPKLWGKHSANWCTPCPVPVTLVLNHFYFLSIAWKEMLWPMRQCQSIHLKEDKNMAPGARGVTCARRWIWSPAKRKDEGREPGREEIITKCNYILPLCSCNTLPTKTDFALWNFHQIESNLKRVRCQVLQLLSTESRALKIKYSKCLLTELTRPPLLCPSTLHPHTC